MNEGRTTAGSRGEIQELGRVEVKVENGRGKRDTAEIRERGRTASCIETSACLTGPSAPNKSVPSFIPPPFALAQAWAQVRAYADWPCYLACAGADELVLFCPQPALDQRWRCSGNPLSNLIVAFEHAKSMQAWPGAGPPRATIEWLLGITHSDRHCIPGDDLLDEIMESSLVTSQGYHWSR